MKDPLRVFEDLPNHYAQTNIAFSPDEQLFLTGTSTEKDSTTGGLLCFYDREKLELVSRVGISPTCSVIQCAWHPKLNQVCKWLSCFASDFYLVLWAYQYHNISQEKSLFSLNAFSFLGSCPRETLCLGGLKKLKTL